MPYSPGYSARRFGQSQEIGGSLALVGVILWTGRSYFRGLWDTAVNESRGLGDREEGMNHRSALVGLAMATAGMVAWCVLAGISWWVALAAVVVFYLIMIVGTWAVCAGGLIFMQNSFSGLEAIRAIAGTRVMTAQSVAMLSVVQRVLAFDLRQLLMPGVLNGWRLGDEARTNRRSMTAMMALAVVVALAASTAYQIVRPYREGALYLTTVGHLWNYINSPRQPVEVAATLIRAPEAPAWGQMPFVAGGFLFVLALAWLRTHVAWWALHPVGFLVAGSWAMSIIWFSILGGWLCKAVTMHYGGPRQYQRLRPAFLGLIVGEGIMGVVWDLVSHLTKVRYTVMRG